MSDYRFKVRRQFTPKGKWTSFPQSGLRVWLRCPRCLHEYRLAHAFCGIAIEVEEAFVIRECGVCKENGQEAGIPESIADCPSCGLECRDIAKVENEYQSNSALRNSYKVKPIKPVKGRCFVCSNPALEMHHADWNHSNNSPRNLIPVCEWCHMKAHHLGRDLFNQLVHRVHTDHESMATLRQTSKDWYRKLHDQYT